MPTTHLNTPFYIQYTAKCRIQIPESPNTTYTPPYNCRAKYHNLISSLFVDAQQSRLVVLLSLEAQDGPVLALVRAPVIELVFRALELLQLAQIGQGVQVLVDRALLVNQNALLLGL